MSDWLSKLLRRVLDSKLGEFLELSETNNDGFSFENVGVKQSALSKLGLPVRCVYGRASKLAITIPWFNLFHGKYSIEIESLHLLVVPSSSVKYDEEKELKEANEAKQKRLRDTERAKEAAEAAAEADPENKQPDSFVQRIVAVFLKNLEVSIKRVHIRYEDKQPGNRYPFAAGVTLDSVFVTTKKSDNDKDENIKIFEKHLELNSLAVYWRPKAYLFSEEAVYSDAYVVFKLFDSAIGS